MAENVKPRIRVPRDAAVGDTITIKTLITHKMESGQRRDDDGNVIPRSIINRFVCNFNGENVIDVAMEPAVSANPYFEFQSLIPTAGTFEFIWYDDDGSVYTESSEITES